MITPDQEAQIKARSEEANPYFRDDIGPGGRMRFNREEVDLARENYANIAREWLEKGLEIGKSDKENCDKFFLAGWNRCNSINMPGKDEFYYQAFPSAPSKEDK